MEDYDDPLAALLAPAAQRSRENEEIDFDPSAALLGDSGGKASSSSFKNFFNKFWLFEINFGRIFIIFMDFGRILMDFLFNRLDFSKFGLGLSACPCVGVSFDRF